MVDLIARKSMMYNTRRLLPDEPFEAKPRDARVLVAIGKARPATETAPASERRLHRRPQAQPTAATHDDLKAVRADYERVVGKRPFNGWDVATLRQKMAAHSAGG